ncbi:nucleotide sugar dehydrogenase [Devosia sp. ZB163]|uniref:nucleotide sugar dehydrogenase n=1 Tax=Devosia sp. ZB163 TaxID=3025938 RepID=UPI002361E19D|nr:nucleotide sugar dehydrogenase [Devosia sp. ZB163]MDC9826309.1 nucleotide sugar dehydrogenase [Devosia sp. ZB163]
MKIAVFGLGYVGSTTAGCLASQGHHIVGIDVSESKVLDFQAGIPPVLEPGLDELLAAARDKGLLQGSTVVDGLLDDADVALVCVGTPSAIDGSHNLSHIAEVTRQIAVGVRRNRSNRLTVAYRSTIRPGTIDGLIAPIFRSILGENFGDLIELVYNPEFLRESSAIADFFNPPKIVIGTVDGLPSPAMDRMHEGIQAQTFHVGYRESELTKFVDNSWHAVKIAFANEIGRICQQLDISAAKVHEIFVSDTKLNISAYYTRPGGAFGGSCLPKDVRALQHISSDVGANTHLLDAVLRTNEAHKHYQFDNIVRNLAPGAKVLLLGLAFKANTDDLRESPNVDMARRLITAGFDVSIYDSGLDATKLIGQNLGYAYSQLPKIGELLIDKDEAEAGEFDLVVAANGLQRGLTLRSSNVVDVSTIP